MPAIADIRPYNVWRAFHGDYSTDAGRWSPRSPGRLRLEERRRRPQGSQGLWRRQGVDRHAKDDKLEAVIIALPLHLHAPVAIAAMQAGLHVITEKLMGHTVCQCKEMALRPSRPIALLATGHPPLQHPLRQRGGIAPPGVAGRVALHPRPVAPRQPPRHTIVGSRRCPSRSSRDDLLAKHLAKQLDHRPKSSWPRPAGAAIDLCLEIAFDQAKRAQIADKLVEAEKFGYQKHQILGADGQGRLPGRPSRN